jgi:hypothetical protein
MAACAITIGIAVGVIIKTIPSYLDDVTDALVNCVQEFENSGRITDNTVKDLTSTIFGGTMFKAGMVLTVALSILFICLKPYFSVGGWVINNAIDLGKDAIISALIGIAVGGGTIAGLMSLDPENIAAIFNILSPLLLVTGSLLSIITAIISIQQYGNELVNSMEGKGGTRGEASAANCLFLAFLGVLFSTISISLEIKEKSSDIVIAQKCLVILGLLHSSVALLGATVNLNMQKEPYLGKIALIITAAGFGVSVLSGVAAFT